MKHKYSIIRGSIVLFFLIFLQDTVMSQVSLPERRRWALTGRFGIMSNNADFGAILKPKMEDGSEWKVNTYFAAAPELVLGFDAVRFRSFDICMHLSALVAQPELMAEGPADKFRVGLAQMGMARMTITFSVNSDGYKMFSLPYHSNHEALLGITGALMYGLNTETTQAARDTLGITAIHGEEFTKALGVYFGWNWRLGNSGWVLGLSGSLMWSLEKKKLFSIETGENSNYESGSIEMAPRLFSAGLGYHF